MIIMVILIIIIISIILLIIIIKMILVTIQFITSMAWNTFKMKNKLTLSLSLKATAIENYCVVI